MKHQKQALGIVGVGLLGCSIALRYREVFPQHAVIGCDADAQHLVLAGQRNAITGTAGELLELARQVQTLVLATPLGHTVEALAVLTRTPLGDASPSLVLDVASVKSVVADAGRGVVHFVATHPMAGSQATGPAAARADLFVHRPWAYVAGDDAGAVTAARAFIEAMGARPVEMDAAEHDVLVARTSHVPQALSTILALHALREPTRGLFGQGLLDMLRLAHSSDAVWNDIYFANSDAVVAELERYEEQLRQFITVIKHGDRQGLRDIFERANQLSAGLL